MALYAGRGGQSSGHGSRQSTNHQGSGRGRQTGGGRGRGNPRCQICRSQGHTTVYCYKRYTKPAPHAHLAVAGGSPADAAQTDAWFPNPGASMHASPDEQQVGQSEAYTDDDVLKVGLHYLGNTS
ncbi:PREDICTED: uncharacterized protein LOC109158440 isoform X2 [Ipomoea nil]|uniref:uncharacterized protein LOC109158440 isoform X2 n=1 Tax=Ipomoea nil TaxID=35883 RepID=UPI000900D18C|nr:PREDICTED: uncharacterized protein LOC109158440 isoform X2 [Ipomoea nil]